MALAVPHLAFIASFLACRSAFSISIFICSDVWRTCSGMRVYVCVWCMYMYETRKSELSDQGRQEQVEFFLFPRALFFFYSVPTLRLLFFAHHHLHLYEEIQMTKPQHLLHLSPSSSDTYSTSSLLPPPIFPLLSQISLSLIHRDPIALTIDARRALLYSSSATSSGDFTLLACDASGEERR